MDNTDDQLSGDSGSASGSGGSASDPASAGSGASGSDSDSKGKTLIIKGTKCNLHSWDLDEAPLDTKWHRDPDDKSNIPPEWKNEDFQRFHSTKREAIKEAYRKHREAKREVKLCNIQF